MASGYTVSGRGDLDALFAGRVSAKRGDVVYQVAGVDISNRYEPIGASTPIAATVFKYQGTDLANLFMGIYTVSVSPTYNLSLSAPGAGMSVVRLTFGATGLHYWGTSSNPLATALGAWITPGSMGTVVEFQWVPTANPANITFSSAALNGQGWTAITAGEIWFQLTPAPSVGQTISTSGVINIRRKTDQVIVASSTATFTGYRPS